eukprot:TRINITY_DN36550_c0_g1_i1.p1 TRINITY_DN36550_c0_g1~~TRINITY_DN36550_c0_g1_i1.p1  ORF type:complete len:896 (-),score=236.89 TRINITY_DN36550_c0_g1_i1:273-2960(-)
MSSSPADGGYTQPDASDLSAQQDSQDDTVDASSDPVPKATPDISSGASPAAETTTTTDNKATPGSPDDSSSVPMPKGDASEHTEAGEAFASSDQAQPPTESSAHGQIERLESKSVLRAQLDTLQSEKQTAEQRAQEAVARCGSLESELQEKGKYEAVVKSLYAEIESLELKRAQETGILKVEVARLSAEKDEVERRVAEEASKRGDLEAKLSNDSGLSNTERDDLEKTLAATKEGEEFLKSFREEKQADIRRLEAENEEAQAALRAEIDRLREENLEAEAQLASARASDGFTQLDLSHISNDEATELEGDNEQLRRTVGEKDVELQYYRTRFQDSESELKAKTAEAEEAQKTLAWERLTDSERAQLLADRAAEEERQREAAIQKVEAEKLRREKALARLEELEEICRQQEEEERQRLAAEARAAALQRKIRKPTKYNIKPGVTLIVFDPTDVFAEFDSDEALSELFSGDVVIATGKLITDSGFEMIPIEGGGFVPLHCVKLDAEAPLKVLQQEEDAEAQEDNVTTKRPEAVSRQSTVASIAASADIGGNPAETSSAASPDTGKKPEKDPAEKERLAALRQQKAQPWCLKAFLHGSGRYLATALLRPAQSVKDLQIEVAKEASLPVLPRLLPKDGAMPRKLRSYLGEAAKTIREVGLKDGSELLAEPVPAILTASEDCVAKIWHGETGDCARTLLGHEDGVLIADWSSDSSKVVTGSHDCTAKVFGAFSGKCERTFRGHTDSVYAACFSKNGKFVLTGSGDGTARLWSIKLDESLKVFRGHKGSVFHVGFTNNDQTVVTAVRGDCLKLWNPKTGTCDRTLLGAHVPEYSASYSLDGCSFVSVNGAKIAKVWDVESNRCTVTLEGHSDIVMTARYAPDIDVLDAVPKGDDEDETSEG